jgi:hypothetical protein
MHRSNTDPKGFLYPLHVKIVLTARMPELGIISTEHRKIDFRQFPMTRGHRLNIERHLSTTVGINSRLSNMRKRFGLVRTIDRDARLGKPKLTISVR